MFNLRTLLEEMIERGASDLHLTAGNRPTLRIDGEMQHSRVDAVLEPKDTTQLAYSVLTENQKKRFEQEDELDFSFGLQHGVHARMLHLAVDPQRGPIARGQVQVGGPALDHLLQEGPEIE
ncbi:MAG: hypothetical protein ACKORK_10825, partial [Gemmatimonadota bacterium]